ncbi:hypothetical protein BD289DRAFT_361804 [Coniella lustricola]|uniref:Uncharacterized protein n=1 Tax=Coniella lustricola TaxID=2025994 RepID=A0A2T3AHI7_9PEZI|nr:hypothetical protein BD289DRAFT_361804 [Coniella lustricola]
MSSIQIPTKVYETRQHCAKEHSPSSSSSSIYSSSPQTPSPVSTSKAAQKEEAVYERRPSLLSAAISKSEATTINIGDPDGPPRLISYLSSSQGFAWNPEIFLPSYIDVDYVPLENRREPVIEITVTDDERRKWFSIDN